MVRYHGKSMNHPVKILKFYHNVLWTIDMINIIVPFFFQFQAHDAAAVATSAVSSAASAATNAASSAATAATSAASAATSGIQNLGYTRDEEDVTDSKAITEEETNIDAKEEEEETVSKEEKFINAIENGEISVFMDMLYRKDELDLNIDNIRDANGLTPLRLAITKGYSGMFNVLIEVYWGEWGMLSHWINL